MPWDRMPNAECVMRNAECGMPECGMPNAECRMRNAESAECGMEGIRHPGNGFLLSAE